MTIKYSFAMRISYTHTIVSVFTHVKNVDGKYIFILSVR